MIVSVIVGGDAGDKSTNIFWPRNIFQAWFGMNAMTLGKFYEWIYQNLDLKKRTENIIVGAKNNRNRSFDYVFDQRGHVQERYPLLATVLQVGM